MQEENDRPLEAPGNFRLDYEPHRGTMLLFMANSSMVCGALSLCTLVPALISLPLGFVVIVLVHRDEKRFDAGLLHPDGKDLAAMASIRAFYGILLSLICWLPVMLLCFVLEILGLLP